MLAVYNAAIREVPSEGRVHPARGLGDAAVTWFIANAPFIRARHSTMLVLTEDAAFGDSRLGRDVHVLSKRAFLQTLENLEIIESARRILDDIDKGGRKVAPYAADRPALLGASGRGKSSWKAALKKRDG